MATYTQDRLAQEQKRRENYDILYKNKSARDSSAKREEPDTYVQDEAYLKRSADDYKNNKGYFSYDPFAAHKVEQKAPQTTTSAARMPSSLSPSREPVYSAPVEPEYRAPVNAQRAQEKTVAATPRRIRRIEESEQDNFEPAYDMAPAKAASKSRLVKKNSYDYEEENAVSLSTNMKVVLALVASIVIIAFTVIFVNSALLNTLEAETNAAFAAYTQMAEQSADLVDAIVQATSADAAANYAASVGMILG